MIVSYIRESTDKQDIETQRIKIREYCERKGITLDREFCDHGFSGSIPFKSRPQARQLFELGKQGKIQEVIVYRLDRLGRDTIDMLTAMGELLKLGLKIFEVSSGRYIDNTPSGKLNLGIQSVVAEFEKASILERSRDATLRLAKEGVWLGGILPYGYRQSATDKEARLILSDLPIIGFPKWTESRVIRTIYEMAADGKSCRNIADYLNHFGIPPVGEGDGKRKQRLATRWLPGRIRNLIVSSTYMGIHYYRKRRAIHDEEGLSRLKAIPQAEWIRRSCPAIVTPDLWKKANAALHQNQSQQMAHPKHQYLLSGLITCGLCGRAFIGTAANRGGGRYEIYYRCGGRHSSAYNASGKRCPAPSLNGTALEAAIQSEIALFIARPGVALRELETQMIRHDGKGRTVNDEIQELENAIKGKAEARSRVVGLYTDGRFNRAELDDQIGRIEKDRIAIEDQLSELRKLSADTESRSRVLQMAKSLLGELGSLICGTAWDRKRSIISVASFDKVNWEIRRRVAEVLVNQITVQPVEGRAPEVRVRYRFQPASERIERSNGYPWDAGLSLSNTHTPSCRPPAS